MTITLSEQELQLISRALDLYSRVGVLQFNYLTDHVSLNKLIHDRGIVKEFKQKTDELKDLFGYPSNGGPGIFNKSIVGEDSVIAYHIHCQIRHFLYLQREDTSKASVDAYPAGACKIAGISEPNFKIDDDKH